MERETCLAQQRIERLIVQREINDIHQMYFAQHEQNKKEVVHQETENNALRLIVLYKGSTPRAVDAARYARVRKNKTKREGGIKKRPMI